MKKNGSDVHHFQKTQGDPRGTAENKGIDDTCVSADFPQHDEENKDQYTRGQDDHTVLSDA